MIDFVAGLALGLVLDVIWSRTPGMSEEETINARWDRLHVLEHYHWGIVCMMAWFLISRELLLGLSAALFITEWTGDRSHPFGVGKSHFISSTILGLFLAAVLVVLYLFV
jgi:hypothetical protein